MPKSNLRRRWCGRRAAPSAAEASPRTQDAPKALTIDRLRHTWAEVFPQSNPCRHARRTKGLTMTTNTTAPSVASSDRKAQGEVDLLGDTPVWTPEIQGLADAVRSAYRLGFRGMAADGQQRCGKTQACRYLQETLAETIGYPLATFMWSIPEFALTERDFVQERMRDSGCHSISHRDIAVLRGRLYDHMAESAIAMGGRRAVIIVDEAQNLTRQQYHYLHHCDNNLEQRKVRPFFLLMGQPELRTMTTSWSKSNGFQVVGRFFACQHTYKGIALADLPDIVEAFDEPIGDAPDATYAHAMPEFYKAGWRLSQISKMLVEVITAIAAKQNISSGVRVPMQSLRAMLLSILFQLIDRKVEPVNLGRKALLKAVRDSAFPTVMSYYVDLSLDDGDEHQAA